MKYIPLKLYIMISVVHANFIRIWGVRVTHLFNFLYCVFFSVCLVLCLVSNVAVFSELPLQFSLNYSFSFLWISPSVFSELPLQFSLNYPFSFLWITPSVFSELALQFSLNYPFSFLWITPSVFSELPLQFSLTFILQRKA
jgi:hypothetical protein